MEDVFTSFIKLKSDFNFTTQQFKEIFLLPHLVALRSYVKAFQYKLIDSVLYTNSNYAKLDLKLTMLALFENVYHFVYECPHSKTFWTDFESYGYHLSNQPIHLCAQNVYLEFYQNNAL